jgi:hypothetical protein
MYEDTKILINTYQCLINAWVLWVAAQGPLPAEGLQRISEINLLWKLTSLVNAEWKYKYVDLSL